MQCFQELGRPTDEFSHVGFRDDGRYEIKCSLGHETATVLQQQKFEVLFDIGAHAILDGYYREAVSSFTSSLERFYEFALRVFLEQASKSEELFQNCWKKVANQSERQLGAFVFLWASNFGESPELLSNPQVSFRNEVIHKGKIPTSEEAVRYGNSVLGVLRPKMLALREQFAEEVSKVTFYHLRDCRSDSDNGKTVSTISISTIVSLTCGEISHHTMSLEEHLIRLSEWRKITGNS
ncbi:hypothetical protein AT959_08555 [Dechloromonas denitrificans]|uniref:Uncharacterized protein n=2 Tax=Dechloromonas denitrificans TaxID=281362 RepID=A0A133XIK0_9RHOO|nr:hypothetical protein AT959_08555 [Dechloromonas denitrificans]